MESHLVIQITCRAFILIMSTSVARVLSSLINWSGDYGQCGNLREIIFKVGSMTILYRQTTVAIPLMDY